MTRIDLLTRTGLAAAALLALAACARQEPDGFFRVARDTPRHASATVAPSAQQAPYRAEPVVVTAPAVAVDGPTHAAARGPEASNGHEAALRYMAGRAGPQGAGPAAAPSAVARVRPAPGAAAPRPIPRGANRVAGHDHTLSSETPSAAAGIDDARRLNREAIALIDAGRPRDAVERLQRALDLQPRDAEMLGNLGYAYMLAGDYRRAKSRFMTSLALAPTRSATWLNLGQTYAETGQRDVAVDAVLKGYRYSTRKPSVRSALQRAASGSRFNPGWREAAGLALERIGDDARS